MDAAEAARTVLQAGRIWISVRELPCLHYCSPALHPLPVSYNCDANSLAACADPDTPCEMCGDNTYAPHPGTRGPCPLCSEVPHSDSIHDADVSRFPASLCLSHLLLLCASAECVNVMMCSTTPRRRVHTSSRGWSSTQASRWARTLAIWMMATRADEGGPGSGLNIGPFA